jgi:probable addiction module antidote protein
MTHDLGITRFDAADYLGTEEAQVAFINDAIESGHPATIANALGAVARAQSRANGMGEVARATGIKRQTLAKSLGPKGNPTVSTMVPVLGALGLRMRVEAVASAKAAAVAAGRAAAKAAGHAKRKPRPTKSAKAREEDLLA